LGIWGAIKNQQAHIFSIGLGLMLLANGLLHSAYGGVTFLYAMHVIPMLTLLATDPRHGNCSLIKPQAPAFAILHLPLAKA
jgi:hypothetical protein